MNKNNSSLLILMEYGENGSLEEKMKKIENQIKNLMKKKYSQFWFKCLLF